MIKKIVLLFSLGLLLVYGNLLFAQETIASESEVRKILESDFSKLQDLDLQYVIPFYQNEQWGLIDEHKKVLIPAKYRRIKLAKPDIAGTFSKRFSFSYIAKNREIKIVDHQSPKKRSATASPPPPPQVSVEPDIPRAISSRDGFKGFQMNDENELTYYSDIYNSSSVPAFNVSVPFLIDGKYHAVARKYTGAGIIDQKGNPLKGFDFNFETLVPLAKYLAYRDSVIWFYFKDKEGNTGFINPVGETKMYNELLRYPLASNNIFGYNVQKSKGDDPVYGVLDYVKFEWLIKPQPQKIISMKYATGQADIDKSSVEDRNRVTLYYFSFERKPRDNYFLNKDLEIMRPQ